MDSEVYLIISNMFIAGSFLANRDFDRAAMVGLGIMWVVISWLA